MVVSPVEGGGGPQHQAEVECEGQHQGEEGMHP